MEIKQFDYDLGYGFAWITIAGKDESVEMTVQCCLVGTYADNSQEDPIYFKKIESSDCGHNDGICGDVNEPAFKYWGENRCMKALFAHAKKAGIKVI